MLATRKPLLGTHKQRHTIKNSSERNECAVLAAFSMANINRPVSNRTSFHLVHSAAEQSLTARTNSLQAFFLRCKSRELCGAPRNAEPTCSVALGDRRWRLRSTRSKSATMALVKGHMITVCEQRLKVGCAKTFGFQWCFPQRTLNGGRTLERSILDEVAKAKGGDGKRCACVMCDGL